MSAAEVAATAAVATAAVVATTDAVAAVASASSLEVVAAVATVAAGYWCWINGVRTWCPYYYGY
jgi:hypothetical protein